MFNKKLFEQKSGGESKSGGKSGGESKSGGNVNKTKKKGLEVVQSPDETGKSIYIDQKEYPTDLYIKLYQVEYMRNEIYSQSYPFINSIQDGLLNPNLNMPLTGSDFNPGWQD